MPKIDIKKAKELAVQEAESRYSDFRKYHVGLYCPTALLKTLDTGTNVYECVVIATYSTKTFWGQPKMEFKKIRLTLQFELDTGILVGMDEDKDYPLDEDED